MTPPQGSRFSPSFREGLQSQTVGVALERVIDSAYTRVRAGERAGVVHGGEGQLNLVCYYCSGRGAQVYACKEAGCSDYKSRGFPRAAADEGQEAGDVI